MNQVIHDDFVYSLIFFFTQKKSAGILSRLISYFGCLSTDIFFTIAFYFASIFINQFFHTRPTRTPQLKTGMSGKPKKTRSRAAVADSLREEEEEPPSAKKGGEKRQGDEQGYVGDVPLAKKPRTSTKDTSKKRTRETPGKKASNAPDTKKKAKTAGKGQEAKKKAAAKMKTDASRKGKKAKQVIELQDDDSSTSTDEDESQMSKKQEKTPKRKEKTAPKKTDSASVQQEARRMVPAVGEHELDESPHKNLSGVFENEAAAAKSNNAQPGDQEAAGTPAPAPEPAAPAPSTAKASAPAQGNSAAAAAPKPAAPVPSTVKASAPAQGNSAAAAAPEPAAPPPSTAQASDSAQGNRAAAAAPPSAPPQHNSAATEALIDYNALVDTDLEEKPVVTNPYSVRADNYGKKPHLPQGATEESALQDSKLIRIFSQFYPAICLQDIRSLCRLLDRSICHDDGYKFFEKQYDYIQGENPFTAAEVSEKCTGFAYDLMGFMTGSCKDFDTKARYINDDLSYYDSSRKMTYTMGRPPKFERPIGRYNKSSFYNEVSNSVSDPKKVNESNVENYIEGVKYTCNPVIESMFMKQVPLFQPTKGVGKLGETDGTIYPCSCVQPKVNNRNLSVEKLVKEKREGSSSQSDFGMLQLIQMKADIRSWGNEHIHVLPYKTSYSEESLSGQESMTQLKSAMDPPLALNEPLYAKKPTLDDAMDDFKILSVSLDDGDVDTDFFSVNKIFSRHLLHSIY